MVKNWRMSETDHLLRALDRFAGIRILCIGDVMLDRFIYGRVTRISPEAPIPVLHVERETEMLGGMGNVLSNIASLGGHAVPATIIGDDDPGRALARILQQAGIETKGLLIDPERQTTVKMRFVSGSQQMLRADYETALPLTKAQEDQLKTLISTLAGDVQGIVVSDYLKGAVTREIAQAVIAAARSHRIPLLIDSKPVSFGLFKGATILKPNRKELAEATGLPTDTDEHVEAAGRKLMESVEAQALVVTRSEQGLSVL
jgi:D-beta-D-heptose 7-phosphate kinase/D-beta-D-heptose 1-phosphate adenosyltransferase